MENLIDIIVDKKHTNILDLADKDGTIRAFEQLTYIISGSEKSKTMYVVMKPFERIGKNDDELRLFKVVLEGSTPCLRIVKDELTELAVLNVYRYLYEKAPAARGKSNKPKSSVGVSSKKNADSQKMNKENTAKPKSSVGNDSQEKADKPKSSVGNGIKEVAASNSDLQQSTPKSYISDDFEENTDKQNKSIGDVLEENTHNQQSKKETKSKHKKKED